ncbi:MAG: L-Ala-D/L-Glu epimerase [Kiloniellales bacterium]|nr:L-Ala-D/L-Glu epimerase [Kiloniellales bacterium]MDJ0971774.1 L-Ala-D/L-Glu epimerase [Kiloniellales bacterium]
MPSLSVQAETWPLARTFTISHGSRTEAKVVVVELGEGGIRGRGEGVPVPRYGLDADAVLAQIESQRSALEAGLTRADLQERLAPGPARCALDCAFWDLEAKRSARPAWDLAGLDSPVSVVTAVTLSIDTPERMRQAAAEAAHYPLLKIKLDGEAILERVAAVRAAAPEARLVVDANEAWAPEALPEILPRLAELGVEMVEQPLPADADKELAKLDRSVPICADESCHDSASVDGLEERYDMVNIKLDKTGGLTEALKLKAAAEARGLGIMVGCMIGTSLSMAPAFLVAQGAAVVDLDGPLWLREDRGEGLAIEDGLIHPPTAALWG